jgi:hypothetical protein
MGGLKKIIQRWQTFFFLHVHTRGKRGIRTSNLRFMRRGSQPIELSIGDGGKLF